MTTLPIPAVKALHKKDLERLARITRAIKSQFAFGKIQTYGDLLRAVGYKDEYIQNTWFPSERDRVVGFRDIADYMDDQRISLEVKQWLELNPPIDPDEKQKLIQEALEKEQEQDRTFAEFDKDYGWIPSITEKAKLFWFQKKGATELYQGIIGGNRGQLLLAGVGTGKTFMYGAVIAKLREANFHKTIGSLSPWPYLVVTKASIVEQTKRVLENFFGLKCPRDVLVINIDQLRSKFGEMFVDEELEIKDGQEIVAWKWRDLLYPAVTIWDECQILKNSGSIQHKIAASYNELENTYQIFSSATPFTRVAEAKCFAVATRLVQGITGVVTTELTNENWHLFSTNIAAPWTPIEHSPKAVDKLVDLLDKYIVRITNVRPQFHAKNKVHIIDFLTAEGKKYYNDAVDRFEKKKAKIQALLGEGAIDGGAANIMTLVAILQYRIAAEANPDRIKWLVANMMKSVSEGYAAVCAVNFKQTITKCVKSLCIEHNISRDSISLIWGGANKPPSEKQKSKASIEADPVIMEALAKAGITMEDLELADVEAMMESEKYPEHLRLGSQSLKQRQHEIDRFQAGKSLYCFYTFRAGGVGLSLHHTDEFTKEKVRHKKSGYAFEEDISLVSTRPRITYVAPTWSAIELVQGIGRAPRLTSLSDTQQFLVFFRGTWEHKVAKVVSVKLNCLTKVVRQKESWESMILGSATEEDFIKNDNEQELDEKDEESIEGIFIETEENLEKQNNKDF